MSEQQKAEVIPIHNKDFLYRRMNYETSVILAKNYSSLSEAMGRRKYQVFKWGNEGLANVFEKIREPLLFSNINNVKYRSGEYEENGEYKNHLFIEKELSDGMRLVYVVDLDNSIPYLYKLDNLYAVTPPGDTVDLLEELDKRNPVYFMYFNNAGLAPLSGNLYLGDIDLIENEFGHQTGVEVYLHEIGHCKDHILNPELKSLLNDIFLDVNATSALSYIEDIFGSLRNVENRFVKKVINRIEEAGRLLYLMEENATNYARGYIVKKRDQGIDLAPGRPGGSFSSLLNHTLTTYELSFFGKIPSESREYLKRMISRKGFSFKQYSAMFKSGLEVFKRESVFGNR